MRECPKCGNSYPETFDACPVDGSQLIPFLAVSPQDQAADVPYYRREPASISIRALTLSIAVLFLLAAASFSGVFLYQYLKPKYGGLVIKTTPPGAGVSIDGKPRGVCPITVGDLRSGGHQLKVTKEGYKDLVQQVEVMPYATENLHWTLEPLVPQLSNEQLAEVESMRKKLDTALKENILLPPPDDYNVLYFANRILAIDPANAYALEEKSRLAESLRHAADLSYVSEDWIEAEKQYKNLALLLPDEVSINERLADIAAKIDESLKDREKQIADWQARAEAALSSGNLLPPAKDNALDAIRTIQRLDRKNEYPRTALVQLKEALQNRGDTRLTAGDWQGARSEFRQVLQYFPDDAYSKSRMALVEGKLAEAAQADQQQRLQRMQEEQQSRQKYAALRQSALTAYRTGLYPKAIADWQEYLKFEPNSDEAYYYIGAGNMEQKQYDTAILNLEKCLSLNPNNLQAHLSLGLLYDRHRGNLKRAADHLRKVKDSGGVEKYSPERLQAMIQDLQDRMQLAALHLVPFAVEHKHTFSSCRGNLRLTEEGVEYKTTETDHSFYEPYTGLRGFNVSGDEISIRTQGNKKYNFRLLNADDGAVVRRLASHHVAVGQ
jgi:tetratricopeptide (TPR) repeat protein